MRRWLGALLILAGIGLALVGGLHRATTIDDSCDPPLATFTLSFSPPACRPNYARQWAIIDVGLASAVAGGLIARGRDYYHRRMTITLVTAGVALLLLFPGRGMRNRTCWQPGLVADTKPTYCSQVSDERLALAGDGLALALIVVAGAGRPWNSASPSKSAQQKLR